MKLKNYAIFCIFVLLVTMNFAAPSYLSPAGELVDAPDLFGPWKIAISPDERHLYVTLNADNSISWFSINNDGSLAYKGGLRDSTSQVDGLSQPRGLAISPNGAMVCVAAYGDCGLSWFFRDTATGSLTFGGCYKDNRGTNKPNAAAFSPDGAYAYLCGDKFVSWFSIQSGSGGVSLAGSLESQSAKTYALAGASGVAVSADGQNVYIAAANINAVACFARNVQSGALAECGYVASASGVFLDDTRDITVGSDGRFLYAAASGDQCLSWLSRSETDGALTYLDKHGKSIYGPIYEGQSSVVLSADGRSVFTASADPGHIFWYLRDTLSGKLTYQSAGIIRDQGAKKSYGLAYCNRTNMLYLSSFDEHRIFRFSPDTLQDTVKYLDIAYEEGDTGTDGLDGASAIAMDPNGARVYVAAPQEQKISWFLRNAATSGLTFGGSYRSWDFYRPITYAAVVVSPDSRNVYGAGNGKLTCFSWDSASQRLIFGRELLLSNLQGTAILAISPDGKHVYASGDLSNTIYRLSRNLTDGMLNYPVPADEFSPVSAGSGTIRLLSISPDAKHVYVTFSSDSIIRKLNRDTSSGSLTLGSDTPMKKNGLLAFSPDGRMMYIARGDSGIAWFECDTAQGSLSFRGAIRPGDAGTRGLLGNVHQVCITPNGRLAAIAGTAGTKRDPFISVFRRDSVNGTLTYNDSLSLLSHSMGESGATAMRIACGPGNRELYVIGHSRNSIAWLRFSDTPVAVSPPPISPMSPDKIRIIRRTRTGVVIELPNRMQSSALCLSLFSCQGRLLKRSAIEAGVTFCSISLPQATGIAVLTVQGCSGFELLKITPISK